MVSTKTFLLMSSYYTVQNVGKEKLKWVWLLFPYVMHMHDQVI